MCFGIYDGARCIMAFGINKINRTILSTVPVKGTMPLHFKFTRVATGEDILLDKVDDMLCDAIGIASDPESFSSQFQLLTTVGDVVNKHGSWDEAIFQQLAAKVTNADYRLTPDLVRRFLQTDLEYKCWVTR